MKSTYLALVGFFLEVDALSEDILKEMSQPSDLISHETRDES